MEARGIGNDRTAWGERILGIGGDTRITLPALCACALLAPLDAHAGEIASADLSKLSIEQLASIQVTSVSKRPESAGDAPSSLFVITRDDIAASGSASLPEILRLAPNLQVYQASASRYVITARGMNGSPAAQNFANKLLVLIDGRSVYTPLFSGVYWDMQAVLPQDVERIEVISGPGATLWGANAVNGVINIITRNSADTQGGLVAASAGDRRRAASLRYGGRISEALTYRAYAMTFLDEDTRTATGRRANDHWSNPQAGFRLDWTASPADLFTLQGDAYQGFEGQAGAPAQDVKGANLVSRWTRTSASGSTLQVQVYYDHTARGDEVDGSGFKVDTYDFDVQHSFTLGERHQVVWGGGYRSSRYDIDGTATLSFAPARGELNLANLFVQDTVRITPAVTAVFGVKIEDDPYVGPEVLPSARLSWTPRDGVMIWGAVSRAVRSPTPFDRDVVERVGGVDFLIGGAGFQPEKLTAFELGARLRASSRASLTLSAFYNDYDDLRSIEVAPAGFLPLRWGNQLQGETYGVEAWGDYQVADWWRLSGAVTYQDQAFRFKPGASKLVGVRQVATDPKYNASIKSSMRLGGQVSLDAALRYVSALPEPRIQAYAELNTRLAWDVTDRVQLSLVGENLLHDDHLEYVDGARIPRSLRLDLQWRF